MLPQLRFNIIGVFSAQPNHSTANGEHFLFRHIHELFHLPCPTIYFSNACTAFSEVKQSAFRPPSRRDPNSWITFSGRTTTLLCPGFPLHPPPFSSLAVPASLYCLLRSLASGTCLMAPPFFLSLCLIRSLAHALRPYISLLTWLSPENTLFPFRHLALRFHDWIASTDIFPSTYTASTFFTL
jgi:hypothetical protein